MSSAISRIRESKYLPYAIFLYIVYLIILFLLTIPYLPELITIFSKREISSDELYQTPIIPFGIAAFLPLVIAYIAIDYKSIFILIKNMLIPFKELNRRILAFTCLYLLLQFVFNAIVLVLLLLIEPDILYTSNFAPESASLIWLVGLGFSVIIICINSFLGWKWAKSNLKQPNGLHWFLGYSIYLITVGIFVIIFQIINPSTKGILLWPITGIAIIGSLSFFIVAFGLFLFGLSIILDPHSTGLSDAGVGFVLTTGILFMFSSLFLLLIYMLTFYLGIFIANWQKRKKAKFNESKPM